MSVWRSTTLGSEVTFQRGFDITKNTQRAGTVPVVSSGGISSYHDTVAVNGPGVVIGRKGTLGRAFFLPEGYWPHDTTLWVNDFKENVPRFVYYFMCQFDMSWLDTGSANPTLNRNHLHPLPVKWPPVRVQQEIVEVLGSLDEKIEANRRLAKLSFDLASAVFDEAKHGSLGFEPLSSLATTVLGGTPSRSVAEFWKGGTVPWLNSGMANRDRITAPSEYITREALAGSAAKLMPKGSTVIAITGATLGQVARLEISASGNQSLVGVWAEDSALNDWLHFAIRDGIPELLKSATGAAQQHVNKHDVDALRIATIADSELRAFGDSVGPLLQTAASAEHEIDTLVMLRDTLLPELMSGRLRVKDAEKKIEEVV